MSTLTADQGKTDLASFAIGDKLFAITIDQDLLTRLDELVTEGQFSNRSRALQEAIRDMLQRLECSRLARECAKLDPAFEQVLAEEGLAEESAECPRY